MKKIYFLIWLIAPAMFVQAQLSVGTDALTILSGTSFSTEGLELIPSANTTISSNMITFTSTVVDGTPMQSIQRVYHIVSPLTYNGIINLYFQTGELNGNSEPMLDLHYRYNNNWVVLPGTVNTVSNYVTYTTPSAIVFDGLTAAEALSVLPLAANSFTGSLLTSSVKLQWKITNNDLYKGFQLEKSNNSGQWVVATYLPSISSGSEDQLYSYNDNDLNFDSRNYRLRLDLKTGGQSYSNIIAVLNKSIDSKVLVTSVPGALDIHFLDRLPKQINLFGSNGQLIYTSQQSNATYHFAVPMGIYQLQYTIDGVMHSKHVIAR